MHNWPFVSLIEFFLIILGLTKFLNTLKEAQKSNGQIIMKYLQNHQECLELFQVLDERMEERSLLEVQLAIMPAICQDNNMSIW